MKEEVLSIIEKKTNDFHNYDFDFDGEKVASDTLTLQEEFDGGTFDLEIQVWIREVVWGFNVEYVEIKEFNTYNHQGDDLDLDISDIEITQLVKF